MLRRLFSARVNLTIAGKRLALPLIPLAVALCGCGCFAAAIADTSMRAIGLLPTYTPSPTHIRFAVPSEAPTVMLRPVASPTEMPSPTPLPTETPSPTPPPTETPSLKPTGPSTIAPTATPTSLSGPLVIIKKVDKIAEYVDLENRGDQPQDVTGWRLVSERGDQVCYLRGVIQPGETLRVWTRNPDGGGYNCGLEGNIWNNDEPDPAALYDAKGVLVSRYP